MVSRRVRPDGAVEPRDRDAVIVALTAAILAVTALLAVAGALAAPTLAALSPLALLVRRTRIVLRTGKLLARGATVLLAMAAFLLRWLLLALRRRQVGNDVIDGTACRALLIILSAALGLIALVVLIALCRLRSLIASAAHGVLHGLRVVGTVVLEHEVEIALFNIRTHEQDLDLIAEAVRLVRALADHRELLLAVLVEIVDHRRDVDEALDAIVELDEDTEGRDAADDAGEFLADELRHVLDLLHVRRLALCLDGDALAL